MFKQILLKVVSRGCTKRVYHKGVSSGCIIRVYRACIIPVRVDAGTCTPTTVPPTLSTAVTLGVAKGSKGRYSKNARALEETKRKGEGARGRGRELLGGMGYILGGGTI